MLKNWSLDTKFFLIFFIAMHALFLTGITPEVKSQLLAAGGLVVFFTVWSIRHRKRMGWRWPGFKPSGVYSLLTSLMVSVCLVFATAGMVIPEEQREILFTKASNADEILKTAWKAVTIDGAPFDPHLTPALLICAGIALFLALAGFQLVTYSQARFLEQCTASENPNPRHQ